MSSRLRWLVVAVSLSAASALAEEGGGKLRESGALLDRSEHGSRAWQFSVHGLLPWAHFGFGSLPIGGGVALYIPLVKDGFIGPVNDEFGLDLGIDAVAYLGYTNPLALYLPVGVAWKFHLLEQLELYVKAGFMPRLWFGRAAGVFVPDFFTALGANWMFSKSVGLKLEVGYPGVRLGIVFSF